MDSELVVDKIRKNSATEVWVVIKEYQGKVSCDIREYFHPDDSPDWLPKRKGVAIPIELLSEAVDAAEALAEKSESGEIGEVAAVPRGNKAKISFGISEYDKRIYAEVRIYYRTDENSDTWKHGKGVTLPLAMLNKLADALRLAEDQAESL